jgi:hypothetical protein
MHTLHCLINCASTTHNHHICRTSGTIGSTNCSVRIDRSTATETGGTKQLPGD